MRWFISITRSLEIIDDVHALSESYLGRQMKGRYVGYEEKMGNTESRGGGI